MKFRLEQLAYFMKIVENGSLNKAAKALFISQPALTKQLLLLENQLGSQLLNRTRSGIELTEAGRFLYERAGLILAQVEETVSGMERFRKRRSLRIGALPSVAHTILPEAMTALQQEEMAGVSISVKDTSAQLAECVEKDMLDLAFVQEESMSSCYDIRPLYHEPYMAILPAHHPFAAEEAVEFAAFCRELLLLHREPCDIRKDFRRQCRYFHVYPQRITDLDFSDSLVAFASKGYGLSLVPQLVGNMLREPSLVIRPFRPEFSRTIYLIYRPESEQAARKLYEAVAALPILPRSTG